VTRLLLAALLTLCVTGEGGDAPRQQGRWRVVADVPLPGPRGRFDYQSFDPTTGWLWIAHMGAGQVIAFDVRSRQVVARVPEMPGVTGVYAVPALQRVFASLSRGHQVAMLDARNGRVLARVPGGRFPDGLAYAPEARKLFVSDEYGGQELVIDVPSMTARPSIPMTGEVGNTQYDSASGRVWVAVQTTDELVAIDPLKVLVVARAKIPGIKHPHGFLIDSEHGLAYVTGEANGRMAAVALRGLRVMGTYTVGDEPDVLAIDAAQHRLFVGSESGEIAAFEIRGHSLASYRAPHAHTVAVDPSTHLVYVPLENVGGAPMLRILALET
jgi:DNA-binding beta-propeller fold protein YncE